MTPFGMVGNRGTHPDTITQFYPCPATPRCSRALPGWRQTDMVSRDKTLTALVQKQTDLFNQEAPEDQRIKIFIEIQEYQKKLKER